ncbi:MAG: class I SAM-dependent methyltransferase [Anaerolineae bacterium]|nr:class I SAM-dependent methyltransferase [Anaerolineae bacterium]
MAESIRAEYETHGVTEFYEQHGSTYRNPHEPTIREVIRQAVKRWSLELSSVLDLACGSGEVTLALRELGITSVQGIDPYTYTAYEERTGQAAERHTFEDIAAGVLEGRQYSLIICSFALHLVEESRLPVLAYQLSLIAPALLILTPHKRPTIKQAWTLHDEFVLDRVRARLYHAFPPVEVPPPAR